MEYYVKRLFEPMHFQFVLDFSWEDKILHFDSPLPYLRYQVRRHFIYTIVTAIGLQQNILSKDETQLTATNGKKLV